MTSEMWRPVPNEPDYEVSDTGRVRSFKMKTVRVLRPVWSGEDRPGARHLYVGLHQNGRQKMYSVHRLVLRAFLGEPPPGLIGCHNNADTSDNRLSNLRWDTYTENALDTIRHGNNAHANKTHCPKGHEYTPENTTLGKPPKNARWCRTCRRDRYQPRERALIYTGSPAQERALAIYRSTDPAKVAAERHGVSVALVHQIRRGFIWARLTGHETNYPQERSA